MMSEKKKPELTEKEIKEQDDYLEEALEETFPQAIRFRRDMSKRSLRTRNSLRPITP